MRGNDVLQGTPDVMVCDSLTGNVLIKMLSSFTTGGSFESTGYGYGPGIGRDYDKLVLIISRASGAPSSPTPCPLPTSWCGAVYRRLPRRSLRWPTRPGWRNSCARSGRLPLRRQPRPR